MLHTPVLLDEIIDALIPDRDAPPQRLIDGTLGAGGHTHALLTAGTGEVLGLDQDQSALAVARATLADFAGRVHLEHSNYGRMDNAADRLGWAQVDGILLDVGVSSMQLDRAERGFSFQQSGPLDMRMDTSHGQTAADIVNTWDTRALADIFYKYGEERHGRLLAQVIVDNRPYETTDDLVQVIEDNKPAQWKENIHPATRIFQALRIAVNDELGALERVIPVALGLLRPGGRLAIISFHSLEDRIVKHSFKHAAADCICPPELPICACDKESEIKIVTRKPINPGREEIAQNPRSRSARLRVAEKR